MGILGGLLDNWVSRGDSDQLAACDNFAVAFSYVCTPIAGGFSSDEISSGFSGNPFYAFQSVSFGVSSLIPGYWGGSVYGTASQPITVSALRSIVRQQFDALNARQTIGCANFTVGDVQQNTGTDVGSLTAVGFGIVAAIVVAIVVFKTYKEL